MKINKMVQTQVEAKTLSLCIKVCDGFTAGLLDSNGIGLKDYEGYVPDFMPGEHHGDYLMLDIDIGTGQIVNWKTPTAYQIESFIDGEEE